MKKLVTCLTAGLLVVGAQSLMAQSTTPTSSTISTNSNTVTAPGIQTPGEHQNRERERILLRMLGLRPEDLKGLSREARLAKMKTAGENVVAELQAKQSAGTLTPEGQNRLEHVQRWLTHAGTGHRAPTGTTPSTPSESN
jgi:hypothetical protein